MGRCIYSNYKFVISYYVTGKNLKGVDIKKVLFQNLDYCKELGLNVCAIICDQGSSNRSCFKALGVNENRPYFFYKDQKYHALYDTPHLIKSVRNTLIHTDLQCEDGIVSWACVKELFEFEKNNATKMCPKITYNHVYPDNWKKMKVSLAAQIFSRSCSAAIKTVLHYNLFSKDTAQKASSTSSFFEKLDRLFDCLNSNKKFDSNIFKSALTKNGRIEDYLREMAQYLRGISFPNDSKVYCFRGLRQAVEAILQISDCLLTKYPTNTYILTRKFQQDPLENLFSLIRSKGGYNANPSAMEFSRILSKIMSSKILAFNSEYSNCENDTEDFLPYNSTGLLQNENDTDLIQKESDNEDDIESDCIKQSIYNLNDNVEDISCQNASLRYFAGFVAFRNLKKINCSTCRNMIRKNGETISFTSETETLIYYKNYYSNSDFGNLNAPSDLFYKICHLHLSIFQITVESTPEIKSIKKKIIDSCIFETEKKFNDYKWFLRENPCYEHHIKILDYFILILLRKFCIWRSKNFSYIATEEKVKKSERKLKILKN